MIAAIAPVAPVKPNFIAERTSKFPSSTQQADSTKHPQAVYKTWPQPQKKPQPFAMAEAQIRLTLKKENPNRSRDWGFRIKAWQ